MGVAYLRRPSWASGTEKFGFRSEPVLYLVAINLPPLLVNLIGATSDLVMQIHGNWLFLCWPLLRSEFHVEFSFFRFHFEFSFFERTPPRMYLAT